jgi:hypothetical protein
MDYLIAVLGVLLLIVPADFFWRKKLQNVTLNDVMHRVRFRYAWIHWVNAADFFRAWIGVYALKSAELRMMPGVSPEIMSVSVVGIAVCIGLTMKQLLFSAGEGDLSAPCAYLVGMTLSFSPTLVAFLALCTGAVVAMGFGSLSAGFAGAGLAAGGLGVIFRVPPLLAAASGGLLFSPALCAVMLQRRLVLAVRPSYGTKNAPLREVPVQRRG